MSTGNSSVFSREAKLSSGQILIHDVLCSAFDHVM